MSPGPDPSVSEVLPQHAWDMLAREQDARLIDVRTRAEWGFVGVPDLGQLNQTVIFAEWAGYPEMSRNPQFEAEVFQALGGHVPAKLLFLCRSGVRSLYAAHAVGEVLSDRGLSAECINVVEGFEGDLDAEGHRGRLNGWKLRGLAWRQS